MTPIFTIGHSNHPMAALVRLLEASGVRMLVDVRTAPYSRHHSQFNKEALQSDLAQQGIEYVYEGQALGGRPTDPTCYRARQLPGEEADLLHQVDYDEIMTRPWFLEGIQRLLALAATQPVAVLCSEEDPSRCHRHHLIACHLMAQHPDVDVRHIRKDGVVFSARSLHTSVEKPCGQQLTLL